MITRKPSSLEVAQGAGIALALIGLLMLLPLGWVCLIVGLTVVGVATYAEHRTPAPVPTTPTVGD